MRSTLPPQGPVFSEFCCAKHSSSPASFQGPGTRYMEMFVQAGGIPWRSCVFLHDLATYTWRSSFRHAGYFGDLMLLHDLATSTWSCSFRLLGAVEIFPAFCSGRRIAGGGRDCLDQSGQSGQYEVKSGQSLHIKIKKTFAPL